MLFPELAFKCFVAALAGSPECDGCGLLLFCPSLAGASYIWELVLFISFGKVSVNLFKYFISSVRCFLLSGTSLDLPRTLPRVLPTLTVSRFPSLSRRCTPRATSSLLPFSHLSNQLFTTSTAFLTLSLNLFFVCVFSSSISSSSKE